jgi:hypothetical protein
MGVEVSKHFTTEVAKLQSDEIARWEKSRSGEITKVDEIVKQRNPKVEKS